MNPNENPHEFDERLTPQEGGEENTPSPEPGDNSVAPENTPAEAASGAHVPASPDPEAVPDNAGTVPAPGEAAPVYRWSFADQQAHDAAVAPKKKKNRGAVAYAVIMVVVFAVSFGMLIATLLLTGNANDWIEGINKNFGISEYDPQSREDVAGVEAAKQSVVVIEVRTATGGGTGTGIVLNNEGYIATNHHVVNGATRITVSFYNGKYATATIVGSSEMDDLAVIKVNASGDLVPATFADSSHCYVGQPVYAIGTPAGSDFGWTTTRGIISYVDRYVKQYSSDGTMSKKLRLLQTDANVNPGNSGGPLINTDGEVIGIVSMKLADGYEGIGFAIPSDGAMDILEAIMKDGNADSVNSSLSFKRPVLGIVGAYLEKDHAYITDNITNGVLDVTDMDAAAREQYLRDFIAKNPATDGANDMSRFSDVIQPTASGVYVMSITAGSGAAEVLRVGDSIIKIQGLDVESMSGMMNVINKYYPGDTVELVVVRNGKPLTVSMTLSAQN